MHESKFPEPKRITDDQQFSIGTFFFQPPQKCDELGGVIAMLQLAVAAHVEVADEIILLCQSADFLVCVYVVLPSRGCCARVGRGYRATPLRSLMNSRRLIAFQD